MIAGNKHGAGAPSHAAYYRSSNGTLFSTHNDYMTPRTAWESIVNLIPSHHKFIWESAYGDGQSGRDLAELLPDKTVIQRKIDYFEDPPPDYDIEITNIPFEKSKEWMTKAKERGKPFIIIMPTGKLITQYFRQLFSGEKIQIVIPRKRIHFKKLVNGVVPDGWKNACCFDCFYYCWKIGLPDDIVWLNN